MDHLYKVISQFATESELKSIVPFGSGHINDSYLVTTEPPEAPDFVLQKINHRIFTNVPQLTENILKVTKHVARRLLEDPDRFAGFEIFRSIPAKDGNYFICDDELQYWRLITLIRNSKSYDRVERPELAYEAGRAFGMFQVLTSDIDAGSLFEILPNFHHIGVRLENFRKTVGKDPAGRVAETGPEISFIETRSGQMQHILRLGQEGKIPLRVTHNDTKINNVLFNDQDKAISVVDLDTVMPGYVLYDFGDAIRTGACTAAEDEADLRLVDIDLALFQAYAGGYLEIARQFLTKTEIDNLAFSARFMTYIIGLRFLTDHLDGDRYYKIRFPGPNRQRARVQFRLLESMEIKSREMEDIIRKLLK